MTIKKGILGLHSGSVTTAIKVVRESLVADRSRAIMTEM